MTDFIIESQLPVSSTSPGGPTPTSTQQEGPPVPVASSQPEMKAEEMLKDKKWVESLNVELLPEFVRILSSANTFKYLTYEAFLQIITSFLDANTELKRQKFQEFALPPGTFAFHISSSALRISMFIPEGKQNISFIDDTKLRVFPNIIVSCSLTAKGEEFHLSDAWYFCTPLTLQELPRRFYDKPDTANKIWALAMPNMYDEGRMCTGHNHLPKVFKNNDIRGIKAYCDVIFNSPFNRDLGVRATRSYRDNPLGWMTLLAKCATDNLPFPYNELR